MYALWDYSFIKLINNIRHQNVWVWLQLLLHSISLLQKLAATFFKYRKLNVNIFRRQQKRPQEHSLKHFFSKTYFPTVWTGEFVL